MPPCARRSGRGRRRPGRRRRRTGVPLLSAFGVHAAAEAGLPIQFHVGLGDRDLDLHRVDPMLLLGLLRQPPIQRVPVLLLHCYPFHRQAGYLAQAFTNVSFDVGLAVNYAGARSVEVVAESLEMAPFARQLYSSDAWGPPEFAPPRLGAVAPRDGPGAGAVGPRGRLGRGRRGAGGGDDRVVERGAGVPAPDLIGYSRARSCFVWPGSSASARPVMRSRSGMG